MHHMHVLPTLMWLRLLGTDGGDPLGTSAAEIISAVRGMGDEIDVSLFQKHPLGSLADNSVANVKMCDVKYAELRGDAEQDWSRTLHTEGCDAIVALNSVYNQDSADLDGYSRVTDRIKLDKSAVLRALQAQKEGRLPELIQSQDPNENGIPRFKIGTTRTTRHSNRGQITKPDEESGGVFLQLVAVAGRAWVIVWIDGCWVIICWKVFILIFLGIVMNAKPHRDHLNCAVLFGDAGKNVFNDDDDMIVARLSRLSHMDPETLYAKDESAIFRAVEAVGKRLFGFEEVTCISVAITGRKKSSVIMQR